MTKRRPDLWPYIYPELKDKQTVLNAIHGKALYKAAEELEVPVKTLRKAMRYHGIIWPFGSLPDNIQRTFKK